MPNARKANAVWIAFFWHLTGGFDLGFERAGFETAWLAEKEPFCQKILRQRFPNAELFKDVTHVTKQSARAVDILTGGFPCQDISVAGKRAGLEGARSGLFWEVVRILGELRPTWFVLENVPGLFSSGEGRDFAIVLNALDELGYGLAWRVLNSQFFGVAQRRRRVFIVGCFGKPCPAEVLFESESSCGDSQAGGEAWESLAATITDGTGRVGARGCDDGANLAFGWANSASRTMRIDESTVDALESSPNGYPAVATALSRSAGHHGHSSPRGDGSDNLVAAPLTASYGKQLDSSDRNGGPPNIVQQAISSKWAKGSSGPAGDEHHNLTVCIQDVRGGTRDRTDSGQGIGITEGGPCYTLGATEQHGVAHERAPADSNGVRDFAGLPAGMDSARYRALGNAVTVNVAFWLAKRILEVEEIG